MKYNVGDKLRIIANIGQHGFEIGEKVTITSCNPENPDYTAEGEDDEWWVLDGELANLELNVKCPHCNKPFVLKSSD